MDKIKSLQNVNNKIDMLLSTKMKLVESVAEEQNVINNETLVRKFQYSKKFNKKTSEKCFTRIVSLSGVIKIMMNVFEEELIVSPLNTILIPPDTVYEINVIKDAELLFIYLEDNNNNNINNTLSIYNNKKNIKHEQYIR